MPQKVPKVQNTNIPQMAIKFTGQKMKPFKNTVMEKEDEKKHIKFTHLSPRPRIYPTMDMTANERV